MVKLTSDDFSIYYFFSLFYYTDAEEDQVAIKMMNLKSEAQNPDMPKECAGCGKKITDRFVVVVVLIPFSLFSFFPSILPPPLPATARAVKSFSPNRTDSILFFM